MSNQYSLGIWDINKKVEKMLEDLIKDSMKRYMNDETFKAFCVYGENLGQPAYRKATAEFLSNIYDEEVDSANIIATYGASFGFMLLMTHFLEAGDFIFVEDLSFGRVILSASEYNLQKVSIDCDDGGIDVNKLEESLIEHQKISPHKTSKRKPYWAIIYLINVCHNPKGTSYSDERCKKVVQLARKYNVLVVTDDVYNIFQYGEQKASRLFKFDKSTDADYGLGHVVSNGSYAKILFPSLRLGWLECPLWMAGEINVRGDVTGGGGYNAFSQNLCACILKNPSTKSFINEMLQLYKNLLTKAIQFMDKNCPKEVEYNRPECSFFLWAKLPSHLTSKELNDRCKKRGVFFTNGKNYSSSGNEYFKNFLRICVSNLSEDDLVHQLGVFCQEARNLIESHTNGYH